MTKFRKVAVTLADLANWDNERSTQRWRSNLVGVLLCPLPEVAAVVLIFCSPRDKIFGVGPSRSKGYWDDWLFRFFDSEGVRAPRLVEVCERSGVAPSSVKDIFPIDIDGSSDFPNSLASVWFQRWMVRENDADRVVKRFEEYVQTLGQFALGDIADSEIFRSSYWPHSGATREGAYWEATRLFARLVLGDFGCRDSKEFEAAVLRAVSELRLSIARLKASGSQSIDALGLKTFDVLWPQVNIPLLDGTVSPYSKSRAAASAIVSRMAKRGSAGEIATRCSDDLLVDLSRIRAELLSLLPWPTATERLEQAIEFAESDCSHVDDSNLKEVVSLLRRALDLNAERFPPSVLPLA